MCYYFKIKENFFTDNNRLDYSSQNFSYKNHIFLRQLCIHREITKRGIKHEK